MKEAGPGARRTHPSPSNINFTPLGVRRQRRSDLGSEFTEPADVQTSAKCADEMGMAKTVMTNSRAVERAIEPGNSAICVHCGAPVKFVARAQLRQVIANVYVDGAWNRVEHFHADCYVEADQPYGDPNG